VRPPPRMFLFGTAHDALPVAQLARGIGWDVVVCTSDPRASVRDRFAGADLVAPADLAPRIAESDRAIAVVMNHDLVRDRDSIALLLDTAIDYIGVLGPRARTRRLLAELGVDEDDPRIHAPIGLQLGAETPSQIAVAIVAEVMAVLTRTSAASLRDRSGPIHETAVAA
jgi:xanthine dehydrogenase accessory factor